ncbi:MAG TPA: NCS2 family permease [Oscillospiraceae bacterium]|nr:NCS2 family permease [Oscillospiraceae bacterium]HPK36393.1 NCS2 family permease [Oscillospiraceae bacterium]HPR76517.1 NCS2 family permease [Oscillospiraceae bacterium]
MDKFFKIKERGSTTRTEIIAGITTFLAMAYILAVNPSILSASGMDKGAIFTATAVSAAFATILMGVFANYPIALASGMGLNAYFAYTVVPQIQAMGITDPWRVALTAILVEGIIFILLSIFKFREALVNGVPANLKYGITAGIGLFIAIIGLKGAGIVVANSSTLVDLGSLKTPQVVLAFVGILIIGILWHYKVKGSILIGILATWILGIIAELTGWYVVNIDAGVYSLIPSFADGLSVPSLAPTFFKFNFAFVGQHLMDFIIITFAFLFVDLFDTVGTVIGVASEGNLLDKDGKLPRAGRVLMTDAIGTVGGSMLGTSTVTSYVESTAGVAEGGKTGLTAIVTGLLFIVSLILSPIFLAIPGFATAPALIFVGLLMMKSVLKMDFTTDIADTVGGFLAICFMPFTYSIANGIMFGMLAWVILKLFTGKARDISAVMWVAFGLFVLRILTMVIPGLSI